MCSVLRKLRVVQVRVSWTNSRVWELLGVGEGCEVAAVEVHGGQQFRGVNVCYYDAGHV